MLDFGDIETIQGSVWESGAVSLLHTHTLSLSLSLSLYARMNTLLQQELSDKAGSLAERRTWTSTACYS